MAVVCVLIVFIQDDVPDDVHVGLMQERPALTVDEDGGTYIL